MLKSVYVVQDNSTMEILAVYASLEAVSDESGRDDVSIHWVPVL
jgi:hypothetical protein